MLPTSQSLATGFQTTQPMTDARATGPQHAPAGSVQAPASLCLLRLSAIGDVTHALPVVETLKNHFPDTPITWVTGALEHKLLAGLPGIQLEVFNKQKGWKEMARLRQRLRQHTAGRGFDALLHMQVSLRANVVGRFIPARRRIGFDPARARDLHRWFVHESIPEIPGQHVLDGFLEFAKVLGAHKPVYRWPIVLSESDREYARNVLNRTGSGPVVVLSPCSSHRLRNWSVPNYTWLVDYLHRQYRATVLLCGGPSQYERETAQAIAAGCQQPPLDLTGQDTLKEFFALLQQVDLVISPDSGPAHMASAAGTPVIALHAASNPRRSGPYNFQALAVDAYDLAARKFKGKSASELAWGTKLEYPEVMDLVTREMVQEKLLLWQSEYAATS